MMTTPLVQPQTAATRKRALIASLTGSSIEWFDYFLYGTAAALVFNKLFFPNFDPVVGLMLSYLSFSLTFFIRPIGGVLFAHIGDRIGRKKTLVITLSLMGGATVLIGCLPTYEQIGIWAPILLISLRVVQGMGIGGEWGGALLLAYEYAPPRCKGLFGSVPQVGVTIGMLLATLAVSLMAMLPEAQFLSWGWRVPFLLSAGLVFLGLWIRHGLDETPEFKQAKASGNVAKMPLLETLRHHWREVLIAAGLKVVETAPFYIFSTFVVSYAVNSLAYEKGVALHAVMLGALVATGMIPLMGALSDRVGRKAVYIGGILGLALFIVPYFMLLDTRAGWGITLGYQLGAALAGGTAPLIATWLLSRYQGDWQPVALYMLVTVGISLVAILAIGRGRGAELPAGEVEAG